MISIINQFLMICIISYITRSQCFNRLVPSSFHSPTILKAFTNRAASSSSKPSTTKSSSEKIDRRGSKSKNSSYNFRSSSSSGSKSYSAKTNNNDKVYTPRVEGVQSNTVASSGQIDESSDDSDPTVPTVILEQGKARLFQDGNPLVYGGAVKQLKGRPNSGDYVLVTDHMGNAIGKGIYNSNSTYRVRMFTRSYETEFTVPFEDVLILRLRQALRVRKAATLPSDTTTAYRAVK